MDPSLGEQYSIKAALEVALLILKCLESDPKKRPSMEEILGILEKAQSMKCKPKVKTASSMRRANKRAEKQPTNSQRRSPPITYNNGHSNPQTHSHQ